MLVAVGIAFIILVVSILGDFSIGPASLGGLLIAAAYIGGMRLVYATGEREEDLVEDAPAVRGSARRAWAGFGAASLGILVAAPLLAQSAEGIAIATGLSASFMGVLAVSIVTIA